MMTARPALAVALLITASMAAAPSARGLGLNSVPSHISVQPVFLVPSDSTQGVPNGDDVTLLDSALHTARTQYLQMLHGRDTFTIAGGPVIIKDNAHTKSFYGADNGGAMAEAAMAYFGLRDQGIPYNRYNNPYIYVVVPWDVGGYTFSIPLNGGINTGGGITKIAYWSYFSMARKKLVPDKLQSTLQHELGHAFGLTHSWQAGYAALGSPDPYGECEGISLMSYNLLHWTSGDLPASQLWLDSRSYKDCPTIYNSYGVDPILLPEEINNLSMNKRVFPNLYLDPEVDLTGGWIERATNDLGTLTLPFDPYYSSQAFAWDNGFYLPVDLPYDFAGNADPAYVDVEAATPTYGGDPSHVVGPLIRDVKEAYSRDNDWYAGASNGLVDLTIYFPQSNNLTISGVAIHTGYTGSTGLAGTTGQACIYNGNTNAQLWCGAVGVDDTISFAPSVMNGVRVTMQAPTGSIVVRGIQVFANDGEIYPHRHPEHSLFIPKVTTAAGNETRGSRVGHVVGPTIPNNDAATTYVPQKMWHSGPVDAYGWTSLQVTFAYPVTLSSVEVHSQHSGLYHQAKEVIVDSQNPVTGLWSTLMGKWTSPDDTVAFTATKARTWNIRFYSTDGYVTVRGLRFHAASSAAGSAYFDTPDGLVIPAP